MTLERRYRGLLALYPRRHRAEYAEEMLGVLLAGASPGQSRPAFRDLVDIVPAALAARWRQSVGSLRDTAWRRAALAVQVFGAILLAAWSARHIAESVVVYFKFESLGIPARMVPPGVLVTPSIWTAVLLAALLRSRPLAVLVAIAGVVAEVVPAAAIYSDTPAILLNVWWRVLAALAVVVASLMATRGSKDLAALPPGTGWVTAAGIAVVSSAISRFSEGPSPFGIRLTQAGLSVWGVCALAVAIVLVLLGARRQAAVVRRRLIAFAGAVTVALPLVQVGFGPFIEHNQRTIGQAALLGPLQWAVLVAIPAATFLFLAAATHRLERSRTTPAHEP